MEWILILLLIGNSPSMTTISGFGTYDECKHVGDQWVNTKVDLERTYNCLVHVKAKDPSK